MKTIYNLTDAPGNSCYFWFLRIDAIDEYSATGSLYQVPGGYEETQPDGTEVVVIGIPDNVELITRILVKWDGCSHVDLEPYVHACGGGGWRQLAEALQAAFMALFCLVEKGDAECAGVTETSEGSQKWSAVEIMLRDPQRLPEPEKR